VRPGFVVWLGRRERPEPKAWLEQPGLVLLLGRLALVERLEQQVQQVQRAKRVRLGLLGPKLQQVLHPWPDQLGSESALPS
jgi:hypothetical protein